MKCDSARLLIDAYMDSELDSSTKMKVEAHLATCAGCSKMLESRRLLSRAIKQAGKHIPAPSALGSQFRREARAPRRFRFGPVALGFAFVVGMAVTLAVWRPWSSAEDRVTSDLLSDHARSVMGTHLLDVSSSDRVTIKNWFTTKGLEYAPSIANLSAVGYQLEGGRLDLVDGRRVGALVYKHDSHTVNVFVTPGDMPGPFDVDKNGFHMRTWSDCGLNYWAISDLPAEDMAALHQQFAPRQ